MSFTIGVDAMVGLDGNGFWVKPLSYKVKRPRISKAQYRSDGTLSYVDLGPGKREWTMTILARNDLLKYDGTSTGVTGEQYRDNLLNSYVNNVAMTIVYTDPKNSTFNVYFLHFEETILDLKSQVVPLSTGGSVAPSYEVAITLLES